MLRKILTLVLLSATFVTQAQKISVEFNYGLASASDKVSSDSQFNHIGFGVSYDFTEVLAAKLDMGLENFSYINPNFNGDKTGSKSSRISLQGVYNLSKFIDSNRFSTDSFNILAHAGAGVTLLKSDVNPGTDKIGSVVFGLTPRLPIADNFFVTFDATAILNIKQHFGFNGEYYYPTTEENFVGQMYNFTLGLQYKFGN